MDGSWFHAVGSYILGVQFGGVLDSYLGLGSQVIFDGIVPSGHGHGFCL